MERRGLSQIVSTVLLMLIFIIAISIIFVMLSPLLQEPSNSVVVQSLSVYLEIVDGSVVIDGNQKLVSLNVKRNPGGGEIADIKVILEDSTGQLYSINSGVSMNELETRPLNISYTGSNLIDISSVAIAPVFLVNGQESLGEIADTTVTSESNLGTLPNPNPNSPAHFDFLFSDDGYLKELNWTNSSGYAKRVVWSERDRFDSADPDIFYLHTTYAWNSVSSSTGQLGYTDSSDNFIPIYSPRNRTQANHITYTKVSDSNNQVVVKGDSPSLEITDTWLFEEDTIKIKVSVKNKLNEKIKANIPVYLGQINLGNYDANNQILKDEKTNGLGFLSASRGGIIFEGLNNGAGYTMAYPESIDTFSPVSAIWDSDADSMTIGWQYLTRIDLPDTYNLNVKAWLAHSPALISSIEAEIDAGKTREFELAIGVADGLDWQKTLEPYKVWFNQEYGTTPKYCPTGPVGTGHGVNFAVGRAPPLLWDQSEYRFVPGTKLLDFSDNVMSLFRPSIFTILQDLEVKHYGVWKTTLHTTHLASSCGRDGISGGSCEHSPNIDLLDPNIDAASRPELIEAFVNNFTAVDAEVFWFARPCTAVHGAGISYHDNGDSDWTEGEDYTITGGTYSGTRGVDLRNPSNVQMNLDMMGYFVDKGVTGFYLDQNGCPGDLEFIDTLYTEFPGLDLFTEGSTDRSALKSSQIPLLRNTTNIDESSLLMFWLIPDATYYGGIINNVLTVDQIDDIIAKGYQPILDGALANGNPSNMEKWRRWVCSSYPNQQERWDSYGRNISGCAEPIKPSYCD